LESTARDDSTRLLKKNLHKPPPPPLCNLSKKTNKNTKRIPRRVAGDTITKTKTKKRSLSLSFSHHGRRRSRDGRYSQVRERSLFFFFFLSFEVDAFEARHDVSNQQQHAFFDQDSTSSMFGMSFSPRMRALNVYKLFSAVVFFQKQIRKTCALQRYENNRGSGIFKTAAIYVLRKEKRLLTTGQITR
jgi:hypothetical protein